MRYISDFLTLPGFGRFFWDILPLAQAVAWLERGPVETRIRRQEMAALVGSLTGVRVFSIGNSHMKLYRDMEMYPPDQALLCFLPTGVGAGTRDLLTAPMEIKREHLTFGLLTCQERYAYGFSDQPIPFLDSPPEPEEGTEGGPQRYVFSSPTLASPGVFDFQLLTRQQAIDWLERGPVTSRMHLWQMCQAFEHICQVPITPDHQNLPSLKKGDQALVFFVGPRSKGASLHTLHPQDICEQYDLGLLTVVSERPTAAPAGTVEVACSPLPSVLLG